jgi:CheY-like chemotaxis protein
MTADLAGVDHSSNGAPKLKVLVADDNRDAADSLAALVRLWGHEAQIAYDGKTALTLVSSEPPDVILADLAMPSLDGRSLAQRLRAFPGGDYFTLVAVTGFAESSHRDRALAAGFDHYLVKPVEPTDVERLLNVIRQQARATLARTGETVGRTAEHVRNTRTLVNEARRLSLKSAENPNPPCGDAAT